jgi:ERCC4-type nuclease
LKRIRSASIEELQSVKGITLSEAGQIIEFLKSLPGPEDNSTDSESTGAVD